jgi:hypothetical protein
MCKGPEVGCAYCVGRAVKSSGCLEGKARGTKWESEVRRVTKEYHPQCYSAVRI